MTGYRGPAPHRVAGLRREVLLLVAAGDKDREIAAQLGLGLRQVQEQVKGLRHALEARNRPHVVARAYELGLLPVDGRVAG